MKRIFFIVIVLSSSFSVFAQEPADALRNSWTTQSGTARTQAVGGAIGALGGDVSAIFVNPAGIGFYRTGDFVITPGLSFLNNKSSYYGTKTNDNKTSFNLGTIGFVTGWGRNNGSKLKGTAFSIAVNRTANFNSNIQYRGLNTQSSYSDKFLEEINNDHNANSVASNYPFGSSLAFNTYWIDTIGGGSSNNYQYQSRAPLANGLLQQNTLNSKGGVTELAIAGAGNLNDKFYYGVTVGVPVLSYRRTTEFLESDPTDNPNNNFDYAAFSDELRTSGVGLNIKAGIIFKPMESLRLGLAVHSPTFYNLEDKYTSSVTANTENYQGLLTQKSTDFNGGSQDFKYVFYTPYKVIASAAYVLHEVEDISQQKGFITADIEYINYKAASFHPDPGNEDNGTGTKEYLRELNKAIDNAYKGAINVRLGGELKFTKYMVRLGGAYYGNPYKDIHGEKGNWLQLTGGLGYRYHLFFVDIAYVHNIRKDINSPYRLQSGLYQNAAIKGVAGNVVLTFGFKI
ncbi:MAG: aromatic hydrocarbon degradation protein [Chitinophagaceae bacterium]